MGFLAINLLKEMGFFYLQDKLVTYSQGSRGWMCAPINILWPAEDQFLEGGDQGQVCAQSCSVGIYFSMLRGEKNKDKSWAS